MKPALLCLTGFLLAAGSTQAAAPSTTIDLFKAYCAGLKGDPNAIISTAHADGFSDMKTGAPAIPTTPDAKVLVHDLPGGSRQGLIVGLSDVDASHGLPASKARSCAVSGPTGGDNSLQSLRDWVGVPPAGQDQGLTIYVYRKGPGGTRSMASATDAEYQDAFKSGELQTLLAQQRDGLESFTVLFFAP